jgi:hypothetical protein|tara:strand:- start:79 stop:525 length:447 start_codon:yes stop_codon:yes gene_type:complete
MNKVAFVGVKGEVKSIMHPSHDAMFTEGETVGNETARIFSYDTSDTEVLDNWYWRDGWVKTKPERPSAYHYWDNYQWNLDTVDLVAEMRNQRDLKLVRCDWTQLVDSPLSDSNKALWVTYRAALRDVPANNVSITSLEDVTWPTPPGE